MGMDKTIKRRKGLKTKHYIWIAAGAILLTITIKQILAGNVSSYRADMDKLTISDVKQDIFTDYINLTGNIEPFNTFYLDVEEGGKVEEIFIEEGEMVKAGDVIFRLRNNDLNLSIMTSETNLAYSKNELRNTYIQLEQRKISNKQELLRIDFDLARKKRNFEQNKELYDKELISVEDYERSKEDYELTKGNRELVHLKLVQDSIFRENQIAQMDMELASMKNNLSMVQQRRENLNVKAPIDGQLGTLNVEIGQSLNKGLRIGQINDLTAFKVVAKVEEYYIDRVVKNLTASVERQNSIFPLKIKKVYPDVREGQFEVDLIFTGEVPENIRTGQTLHLRLELGESAEGVLLDRGGFFQNTGGQWVYVLNAEGTEAVKRNIKIGRQNPLYYEVIEGLQPGEKVITSSYEMFGDNDRIILK